MRWIFRLLGAVIVLIILAVGAISFLPGEKIAAFAAREISARTGREVRLTGDVSPVFYPVLGVRTGPVTIANADWAGDEPMLSADSLLVGVELVPLFSGTFKIKELHINSPVIRLEKAKDGRANWELATASQSSASGSAPSGGLEGITLADGQIVDGTFSYVDRQTGTKEALSGVNLSLAIPDMQAAVRLAGSLVRNGEKLNFDATIGTFATFVAGAVSPVAVKATGSFGTVAFDGRGGLAPVAAKGALKVDLSNPANAFKLAGVDAGLPDGLGKTLAIDAELTYTADGNLYLRGGQFGLGQNVIAGDVDVSIGGRSRIKARLTAGALDFSAMTTGSDSGTNTAADAGWSRANIDASGLQAMDADITLTADAIDLGAIRFDAIKAKIGLDNGRLVADLGQAKAYNGTITGQVVLNARKGLSAGGDLAARQVDLQALMKDVADYDRLAAKADLTVKFLASGNSVNALMHSLSGSGSVRTGAGEIIGFDLAGMLKTLDTSYRGSGNKTVFNAITATYAIKDGVLSNDDLLLESPIVDATGAGQVDLGAQKMTYRVNVMADHSKVVNGSGGGIILPVLIEGPWASLSYKADLQGVLNKEIDKQKKEAETKLKATLDEARKEAEQKLRDDAENALKEGVEKSLGDLLKNVIKP